MELLDRKHSQAISYSTTSRESPRVVIFLSMKCFVDKFFFQAWLKRSTKQYANFHERRNIVITSREGSVQNHKGTRIIRSVVSLIFPVRLSSVVKALILENKICRWFLFLSQSFITKKTKQKQNNNKTKQAKIPWWLWQGIIAEDRALEINSEISSSSSVWSYY